MNIDIVSICSSNEISLTKVFIVGMKTCKFTDFNFLHDGDLIAWLATNVKPF